MGRPIGASESFTTETTMTTQTKLLIEYLSLNLAIAAHLVDACNTITGTDHNGNVRSSVAPSDFSSTEWTTLVAIANLSE
jgi:hypothetical protein